MSRKKEGKTLTFEEKITQITPIISKEENQDVFEIFSPKGFEIIIGDRKYILYPLPLKKIADLNRLGKQIADWANSTEPDDFEKSLKTVAESVATVLNAPDDIDFLYENLTQLTINFIFEKLNELSQGKRPKV